MANQDLAKLVVKLEAQTSQYQAELEKARKQLGKFDSDVSRIAASAGKAIGAAITGAAAGVAYAVKQSLDAADELGNVSQKTGVAVEELSKLTYASKLSDVATEQLNAGLIKLSKSAVEAAGGTGDAAIAFKALGVETKNADGSLKSTDDLFLDLAEAFSKFQDGPEKAAAAMAIFGKSGAELIPLLDNGREGIKAYGAELEKFGGVVTKEASDNADEFNRNLDRLKVAAGGLSNQLATALGPTLVDLSAQIVKFTSDSDASTKVVDGVKVVFRGLTGAAIVLSNAFQIAGDNIAAVAATANAVAHRDFAGALDIIKQRAADFKEDIEDIKHAFDETKAPAQDMGKTATTATTEAAKSVLNYSGAIAQARDRTKEAKDITDAWALSLQAAEEIQKEVEALDKAARDTQSRQDETGLNAADEIQAEVEAMQKAEEQKTEDLAREAEIRRRIREDELNAAVDALGYAGEAAQALGKKGFKAFKAFAIAQTIIDTYRAAEATYASLATIPVVGPALGVAGAAAAVAAGLARVGQIRAAEPSGYEKGGVITGGEQTIRVNENGTETVMNARATSMFTPELQAMNEGRIPWDHSRIEAANEPTINIVNQPGVVTIRQDDGTLLNRLAEPLAGLVETRIAAGVTSGSGKVGQAVGNKFGLQGRAVR